MTIRQVLRLGGLIALAALSLHAPLSAQQRDEQFYFPGAFNWKFLSTYPEGARLFNAFDYGHAVLYERLYTTEGTETGRTLERQYQYLTTDLLIRPPRFAIAEEAVMPAYAKLAWRAKQMFDWAHILHRQIYDIYSDERLTRADQDARIERVTDYYLSRKEYAFLDVPKSMELMDDQYYSKSFREAYPKFNGLIWSYHWLQVGLYEPLIVGRTAAERKTGVQATIGRFWSMLEEAPSRMPREMPMTSGIAPVFSAAHPRAAVIFDNLHMMHDIISDILHNDVVPMAKKGEVIGAALDEFQNPATNVMTIETWRNMADHMGGVDAMGGAATGILKDVQAPSGGHDTRPDTSMAPAAPTPAAPMSHEMGAMGAAQPGDAPDAKLMRELHQRMMQDTVIHRRMMADTTMQRLMIEMMAGKSGGYQAHPAATPAPKPEAKPAAKTAPKTPLRKPATPTPTKKPAAPAAGHDGHGKP